MESDEQSALASRLQAMLERGTLSTFTSEGCALVQSALSNAEELSSRAPVALRDEDGKLLFVYHKYDRRNHAVVVRVDRFLDDRGVVFVAKKSQRTRSVERFVLIEWNTLATLSFENTEMVWPLLRAFIGEDAVPEPLRGTAFEEDAKDKRTRIN